MKKLKYIIYGVLLMAVTSCDDFLGDNENPNTPTEASPNIVLPNALTSTASVVRSMNSAAGWVIGNTVNAGGFGGWGDVVYYNYTTGSHSGQWASVYDDLNNYKYILTQSEGEPTLAYYQGVAMIMMAYDYQMLVDFYGDVPYTDALQGVDNLSPAYTGQEEVYQDLVLNLNEAIEILTTSESANSIDGVDVIFNGNVKKWAQFANTLKLRMLMRMSDAAGLSSFVDMQFQNFDLSLGFIEDDVLVNPGYGAVNGQQNPYWEAYVQNASGTASSSGRSQIPSIYIFSFYDGTRIDDAGRGQVIYRDFDDTPVGQLGELTDNPNAPSSPNPAWLMTKEDEVPESDRVGVLKGANAGSPLMLVAEAKFLEAEAILENKLAIGGSVKDAFNEGIKSSFKYLYKNSSNSVPARYNIDSLYDDYLTANASNVLVNIDSAITADQKLEAIITQKYIALNFVHAQEAWSEFRRTGYPSISEGSTNAEETFASILSTSTREDKLPIRFLYPDTEFQLNGANVPPGINQFTSAIFFQKN